MSNQTIDEKPSRTAGIVCFFRACANKEKNEQIRSPDYLAKIYLKGFDSLLLKFHRITLPIAKRKVPTTYEYVIARTKFFDEIFKKALVENFPQIVFLGAGYDTRPYRFKDYIKQTETNNYEQILRNKKSVRKYLKDPKNAFFGS